MVELLKEQLEEYKKEYSKMFDKSFKLSQEDKKWKHLAKPLGGLDLLIKQTETLIEEALRRENLETNKPEDLVGEAKRFEDATVHEYKNAGENVQLSMYSHEFWAFRDFYKRPFEQEMIEKYFEGWRKQETHGQTYYRDGANVIVISFIEDNKSYQFKNNGGDFYLSYLPIKTLSCFINACVNSDIKLIWR